MIVQVFLVSSSGAKALFRNFFNKFNEIEFFKEKLRNHTKAAERWNEKINRMIKIVSLVRFEHRNDKKHFCPSPPAPPFKCLSITLV